jgi:antirestriction protein ArdC
MGRHVRKDEKGIAILAPIVRRVRVKDEETGDDTVITGSPSAFRVTHVFDISQTNGEELPAPPVSMLEGDDTDALYTRLRGVVASVGYTVEEDYLDGQNGDCTPGERRIRVEVRNQPAQQVKTLAHELAHAILHDGLIDLPREPKELEAESVAFIVCADLGIDSSAYSFGYVTVWMGGEEEAQRAISECAQRIQRAARLILDGGIARDIEEVA